MYVVTATNACATASLIDTCWCAQRRADGLTEKEPRLQSLLHSPRLAKAAMDLEGMADGVRFYQSQAFFKEPGDTGSTFHTDNYACPLDTSNQLTTAWLPLVETDREMGMLAFARGSHTDMNIQFWNNGTSPVAYRAERKVLVYWRRLVCRQCNGRQRAL